MSAPDQKLSNESINFALHPRKRPSRYVALNDAPAMSGHRAPFRAPRQRVWFYSIAACAGRAEIPIIAMGSADAVGEHDLSEIGF